MSKMSELDADRQRVERLTDVVPPPPFAKSKQAGEPVALDKLGVMDIAALTAEWRSAAARAECAPVGARHVRRYAELVYAIGEYRFGDEFGGWT